MEVQSNGVSSLKQMVEVKNSHGPWVVKCVISKKKKKNAKVYLETHSPNECGNKKSPRIKWLREEKRMGFRFLKKKKKKGRNIEYMHEGRGLKQECFLAWLSEEFQFNKRLGRNQKGIMCASTRLNEESR